ncbi:MAG: hypothetical protein ACTS5I_03145, partial [Rhodanobacter sp.]
SSPLIQMCSANGRIGGPGARVAKLGEQMGLVGFEEVFALEKRFLSGLQHPRTAKCTPAS